MGEGNLRPIEVVLAFNAADDDLEALYWKHRHHTCGTFERHAARFGLYSDEIRLYWDIRRSAALRGDVYVLIADIELRLHGLIQQTLVSTFGNEETGWWRRGVPSAVRKACVQLREDDPEPVSDPFCYTTFIHLSEIIDANWRSFEPVFPREFGDKKKLMGRLRSLNHLRNAVMHPIKQQRWRPADLSALLEIDGLLRGIPEARDGVTPLKIGATRAS